MTSEYPSDVEIIKVEYGPLGGINRRAVESAYKSWLSRGFILAEREEVPQRLFRRAYTALTFVKPAPGQLVAPAPLKSVPAKKRSSSGAGCLLLLIILGIVFWPNIEKAVQNVSAQRERDAAASGAPDWNVFRRDIAALPGIVTVRDVRPGTNEVNGKPFVIVTLKVAAVSLTEATARSVWSRAIRAEPSLWSFGAIMSDGTRVHSIGWDSDTGNWATEDFTGMVEPF